MMSINFNPESDGDDDDDGGSSTGGGEDPMINHNLEWINSSRVSHCI